MTTHTALNFTNTFRDGVLIISVRGAVDSTLALEQLIENATASSATDVIIVLSELEYINSAGFGALIRLSEALDQSNKGFFLVGLSSKIHLVFQTLGAHSVLNVLPTLDDALARIRAGRASKP